MAIDPVCDMTVPEDAKLQHIYQGKTFLFCSEHCQIKFKDHPQQYVNQEKVEPLAGATSKTYTCPMHPEIKQAGQVFVQNVVWRWNPWVYLLLRQKRSTPAPCIPR